MQGNVILGISIHAPHAGRDPFCGFTMPPRPLFQSTRPMRGATYQDGVAYDDIVISIHAPHAGRDSSEARASRRYNISIHAPHAGRDPSRSSSITG